MSAKVDMDRRQRGTTTMVVDCPHDADSDYAAATGVALTAAYEPTDSVTGEPLVMHGLLCTAGSGNIDVTLEGGGQAIFPLTVASGTSSKILRNCRITKIGSSATTTFNGHIFPLF